jgi:hypothetical protein
MQETPALFFIVPFMGFCIGILAGIAPKIFPNFIKLNIKFQSKYLFLLIALFLWPLISMKMLYFYQLSTFATFAILYYFNFKLLSNVRTSVAVPLSCTIGIFLYPITGMLSRVFSLYNSGYKVNLDYFSNTFYIYFKEFFRASNLFFPLKVLSLGALATIAFKTYQYFKKNQNKDSVKISIDTNN